MTKTIGDAIDQPALKDFIHTSLNPDESLQATAVGLDDHILLLTNYRVIVINSCDPGLSPDGIGFETTNFLLRDISHIDVRLQNNACELQIVSKRQKDDMGESQTIERCIQFAHRFSSEVVELAEEIEAKIRLLRGKSEKVVPPVMTGKQLANLLDRALVRAIVKQESSSSSP